MNEQTFDRRYQQLVTLLNNHKHKDELLNIMKQQMVEDCVTKDKHIKLKVQAATKDSTLEQIVLEALDMYIQSNCE